MKARKTNRVEGGAKRRKTHEVDTAIEEPVRDSVHVHVIDHHVARLRDGHHGAMIPAVSDGRGIVFCDVRRSTLFSRRYPAMSLIQGAWIPCSLSVTMLSRVRLETDGRRII